MCDSSADLQILLHEFSSKCDIWNDRRFGESGPHVSEDYGPVEWNPLAFFLLFSLNSHQNPDAADCGSVLRSTPTTPAAEPTSSR